jgi:hypothetical protein
MGTLDLTPIDLQHLIKLVEEEVVKVPTETQKTKDKTKTDSSYDEGEVEGIVTKKKKTKSRTVNNEDDIEEDTGIDQPKSQQSKEKSPVEQPTSKQIGESKPVVTKSKKAKRRGKNRFDLLKCPNIVERIVTAKMNEKSRL